MDDEGAFRGGAGEPLVLLHSALLTWREWRCVVPELTAERDVLAPTLPGSYGAPRLDLRGRSFLHAMADHVEDLLDEAGWDEPVPIAGSSHGGVIALELAARGRASAVVALAPPWMSTATAAAYGGAFGLGAAGLRLSSPLHRRLARWPRTGGLILHGALAPTALEPDDLVDTLRSVVNFPLLGLARSGLKPPLLPDFELIDQPVTLVWGTADRLVPGWMLRRWKARMPHAEVVELPGFPHIPHLRDPDRVADLILRSARLATAER